MPVTWSQSGLVRLARSTFILGLIWGSLACWVLLGAGVLSFIELDAEGDRTLEYCSTVAALKAGMNTTQLSWWSGMLSAVSGSGICRQPNCAGTLLANASAANATALAPAANASAAADRAALHLNWELEGSIFFCVTTVTTVGYGTYVPATQSGRAFATLFALVGIPLFTAANGLLALRLQGLASVAVGARGRYTALLLVITTWFVWMASWGAWFGSAEGWGRLSGFWFAFVTTTTIGLGDFAPSAGATRDSPATYVFIFGGIALFGTLVLSVVGLRGRGAVTDHVGKARAELVEGGGRRRSGGCCERLRRVGASVRALQSWVTIFAYTLFGGAAMSAIEGGGSALTTDLFSKSLGSLQPGGDTYNIVADTAREAASSDYSFSLSTGIHKVLALLDATGTCPPPDEAQLRWSLLPAAKYAFSLITTIGWGDLSPKTSAGKLFSMPFALLGFWLFASASAATADLIHRRILRNLLRSKQQRHGPCDSACFRLRYAWVGMSMLVVWWMLATLIFAATEEWAFGECAWFTIVSITTVGFGDFSPGFRGGGFFVQWAVLTLGLKMFALVKQGFNTTSKKPDSGQQSKKKRGNHSGAELTEHAAEETSQDVANPAAAAGRGGANDRNPLGLDRDTLAVLDRSKSKSKSKSTRQRGDDVRTKIVL